MGMTRQRRNEQADPSIPAEVKAAIADGVFRGLPEPTQGGVPLWDLTTDNGPQAEVEAIRVAVRAPDPRPWQLRHEASRVGFTDAAAEKAHGIGATDPVKAAYLANYRVALNDVNANGDEIKTVTDAADRAYDDPTYRGLITLAWS